MVLLGPGDASSGVAIARLSEIPLDQLETADDTVLSLNHVGNVSLCREDISVLGRHA